jgi:hypothetical protein
MWNRINFIDREVKHKHNMRRKKILRTTPESNCCVTNESLNEVICLAEDGFAYRDLNKDHKRCLPADVNPNYYGAM